MPVMPANVEPKEIRVFFGLSGFSKTTLSRPEAYADRRRRARWATTACQFRRRLYAVSSYRGSQTGSRTATSVLARCGERGARRGYAGRISMTAPEMNTRSAIRSTLSRTLSARSRAATEERGDAGAVRSACYRRRSSAGAGDVSLPVGIHCEGRGHGTRLERPGRNSRPASARRSCRSSVRLRRHAARSDRRARCRLLAGQYRLDQRQIRRRQPHARSR